MAATATKTEEMIQMEWMIESQAKGEADYAERMVLVNSQYPVIPTGAWE